MSLTCMYCLPEEDCPHIYYWDENRCAWEELTKCPKCKCWTYDDLTLNMCLDCDYVKKVKL